MKVYDESDRLVARVQNIQTIILEDNSRSISVLTACLCVISLRFVFSLVLLHFVSLSLLRSADSNSAHYLALDLPSSLFSAFSVVLVGG